MSHSSRRRPQPASKLARAAVAAVAGRRALGHPEARRRRGPRDRRQPDPRLRHARRHAAGPAAARPRAAQAHRREGEHRRLHRHRRRQAAVPQPLRRQDRGRLRLPAAGQRGRQRVRDDRRRAEDPRDHPRARGGASRSTTRRRAPGHVASLLTQERPNVFTQKVANIEPGKAIDIDIRYFHTLGYTDGWYEFVFPMVVGPRFNPPGTTDGVGAVGQGSVGASRAEDGSAVPPAGEPQRPRHRADGEPRRRRARSSRSRAGTTR